MRIVLACPVKNLEGEEFHGKFFSHLLKKGVQILKLLSLKLIGRTRLIFNGACLVSILFLLTLGQRSVFAHTEYSLPDVSEAEVNDALAGLVPLRFLPGDLPYPLISAKESVQRFFQPSAAARAQFDLVLCGKRIKESYILFAAGDVKNTSVALDRYGERLLVMVAQIEKARSQNQDVAPLVDRIALELEGHETILSAIYGKWQGQEDAFDFDSNFADAVFGFSSIVSAINNVRPGLRDRYSIPIEDEDQFDVIPYITPPALFEATPSVRPRRIIY